MRNLSKIRAPEVKLHDGLTDSVTNLRMNPLALFLLTKVITVEERTLQCDFRAECRRSITRSGPLGG